MSLAVSSGFCMYMLWRILLFANDGRRAGADASVAGRDNIIVGIDRFDIMFSTLSLFDTKLTVESVRSGTVHNAKQAYLQHYLTAVSAQAATVATQSLARAAFGTRCVAALAPWVVCLHYDYFATDCVHV
jgi:hypothetical protein